jgi:plastocyanin
MPKLTIIKRLACTLSVLSLFCSVQVTLAQEKNEEKNQIEIKGFHFAPQTLTVKSGAKVTWINRDDDAHVVSSSDKKFEKSPPLDTDQKFTITVGAPGTYNYFCSVHPKMTGKIIVEKP